MTQATRDDLLKRAHEIFNKALWWTLEGERWLREYEAAMKHQHRYDTLRIQDDDGRRVFTVCLECGDRKYEAAMREPTVKADGTLMCPCCGWEELETAAPSPATEQGPTDK